MKNSADQGECYPQRPRAEVDNTSKCQARKEIHKLVLKTREGKEGKWASLPLISYSTLRFCSPRSFSCLLATFFLRAVILALNHSQPNYKKILSC